MALNRKTLFVVVSLQLADTRSHREPAVARAVRVCIVAMLASLSRVSSRASFGLVPPRSTLERRLEKRIVRCVPAPSGHDGEFDPG